MNNVKVNDTHSFALVGHSGDGKTSLGEAILHITGATTSLGSVMDGTAHLTSLASTSPRRSATAASPREGDRRLPSYRVPTRVPILTFLTSCAVSIAGITGVS